MAILSLASMRTGQKGQVVDILDNEINFHKLVLLGFQRGASVTVLGRAKTSYTIEGSIVVQVDRIMVSLLEEEASKVLVKVEEPIRWISPWDRPEIWRPIWPFFPRWGAS